MVLRVGSADFRLSGDSGDDSGVVPHEESRPFCDIEDIGDVVLEADEVRCAFGTDDDPLAMLDESFRTLVALL